MFEWTKKRNFHLLKTIFSKKKKPEPKRPRKSPLFLLFNPAFCFFLLKKFFLFNQPATCLLRIVLLTKAQRPNSKAARVEQKAATAQNKRHHAGKFLCKKKHFESCSFLPQFFWGGRGFAWSLGFGKSRDFQPGTFCTCLLNFELLQVLQTKERERERESWMKCTEQTPTEGNITLSVAFSCLIVYPP